MSFISLLSCKNQTAQELPVHDTLKQLMLESIECKPHPRQLAFHENEFTAFIHFGVNTFTGREWGTGMEDPKIFNPKKMDTDQWCEAMKSAGMKMVIITAKHHDGFCLWPSRYTNHSVASSPWKNGNGDVVKELAISAKKYGLKLGVYLSPADLFQIENAKGLYGNKSEYSQRSIPRDIEGRPFENGKKFSFLVDDYNEYFLNQLYELLTEYGPVHEVWFDGAHPKRKGNQQYTYKAWYKLIRELAPEAVIFGKGPDVRWCGNEAGRTRESEWSVLPIHGNSDDWDWPDMTGDDLGSLEKISQELSTDAFLHYYPAETNTSIREGWFWRDEKQNVKTSEEIIDTWYRSVGGNTVFLLNIPPNTDGLFSSRDVEVLEKVGEVLGNTFEKNLLKSAMVKASSVAGNEYSPSYCLDNDPTSCWKAKEWELQSELTIETPITEKFNRLVFQEDILNHSQRISSFAIDVFIDNKWEEVAKGTTVGYKRICRFPTMESKKIRIRILEARVAATISNIELYYEDVRLSMPIIQRDKSGKLSMHCDPEGPEIYYTLNGESPSSDSKKYNDEIAFPEGGTVKAIAVHPDTKKQSEESTISYDICPEKWSIESVDSEQVDYQEEGFRAIDGDLNTIWMSTWKPEATEHPHHLSIHLGEIVNLKGFSYTPPQGDNKNGTIKDYHFLVSMDGKNWESIIENGSFSNIKNNPVQQKVYFEKEIKAAYIQLQSINEINRNPWAAAAEVGVITK